MANANLNLTSQNRFRLILSGERFRHNPLELMCNGVTLPGMSGGVMEIPSPARPLPQPGGSIMFDDLYINFIVSEDAREWIYLFNWIREIEFASTISQNPYYSQAELIILSNKFNPLLSFTFHDCFPYVLGVLDFSSENATTDTMTSNCSFKFTDYTLNTTI